MALHKLQLNQLYETTFSLLAIHCNLEDYRLAYILNSTLNIGLKRCKFDLDFEYNKASYPLFEWEDSQHQIIWNLIGNACKREEEGMVSSGSLFNQNQKIIKTFNLIPEQKSVNFFLKIDNDGDPVNERSIIGKVQDIPQIAAVYSIDVEQLKSKAHLIF